MEEWTAAADGGEKVDSVYLDFTKSFDSVNYLRLTVKESRNGISGQLSNWFKDCVEGRWYRVVDGSDYSTGCQPKVGSHKDLFSVSRFSCYI